MNRRALGARGESLAGDWYLERGYTILDRNWRTRTGELDLVLESGGIIVFCEVKTRTSNAFGAGVEAVTREKQLRIRRLAAQWLEVNDRAHRGLRFDVVSILAPSSGRPQIDVYEAAF